MKKKKKWKKKKKEKKKKARPRRDTRAVASDRNGNHEEDEQLYTSVLRIGRSRAEKEKQGPAHYKGAAMRNMKPTTRK